MRPCASTRSADLWLTSEKLRSFPLYGGYKWEVTCNPLSKGKAILGFHCSTEFEYCKKKTVYTKAFSNRGLISPLESDTYLPPIYSAPSTVPGPAPRGFSGCDRYIAYLPIYSMSDVRPTVCYLLLPASVHLIDRFATAHGQIFTHLLNTRASPSLLSAEHGECVFLTYFSKSEIMSPASFA